MLASCVRSRSSVSWHAARAVRSAGDAVQGGSSLRDSGVRGGIQHAQDDAVKLETDSRGEQRLGEKFAFMRMSISLVATWVVCCHGYKAGCNPCARFEPVPLS